MTGIILVLAANTAFNGFPVLGSILAQDGLAPRSLGSRGDRLAYSNGIVFLAAMSMLLIWVFDAETTKLIQLYIVGVFVSFNLSQLGMIRHWTRHLEDRDRPVARRGCSLAAINTFGLGMTAVVLVIVLITKFLAGAWITILAMGFFFMVLRAIGRHYARVELELAADEQDKVMPTRVHAIVLASKLHKPTLRALAFARATRPNVLEAIYVSIDPKATNRLLEDWDERRLDIPLKVLHSPYREVVRPIVEYTQEIRRASPRGVVAVYIPEYVVGRWWEQLLHNQTALRLKGRLLFTPGVMVISVPFQLRSSQVAQEREKRDEERVHAGDLRRGRVASRSPPGRSTTNEPYGNALARPAVARGWGSASRPRSARSPTAATASRVSRSPSPGSSSYATRCRASGWSSRSPRAPTATGSGAGTPSRSCPRRRDRVEAPCPVRRTGALRGCDFQHAAVPAQRDLKAAVVREQLVRLGRLDADSELVAGLRVEASRWRAAPTTACAGGPVSATPRCRTAARPCGRTAPTSSSPSTTA